MISSQVFFLLSSNNTTKPEPALKFKCGLNNRIIYICIVYKGLI